MFEGYQHKGGRGIGLACEPLSHISEHLVPVRLCVVVTAHQYK